MRAIHALAFLAALSLIPAVLAQNLQPASSAAGSPALQSRQPTSPSPDPGQSKAARKVRPLPRESAREGDEVCYFMRSYFVARERRGSDVVRPAGYTTCVPAVRFQMKSVGEHLKPAE